MQEIRLPRRSRGSVVPGTSKLPRENTSESGHTPLIGLAAAILLFAAPTGATAQSTGDYWRASYVGIVAGSGHSTNNLVDVEGFANPGNPGHTTNYDASGAVGGLVVGKRYGSDGLFPFRVELGLNFGDIKAETNMLDPEGLDESAIAQYHWISSVKFGLEIPMPNVDLFVNAGLAAAEISNSATDIDFEVYIDPDDSFDNNSVATGVVYGIGLEFPMSRRWSLRVDGLQYDFGTTTFEVNRSGDNTCGAAGMVPCPYQVTNRLGVVNVGVMYQFE